MTSQSLETWTEKTDLEPPLYYLHVFPRKAARSGSSLPACGAQGFIGGGTSGQVVFGQQFVLEYEFKAVHFGE